MGLRVSLGGVYVGVWGSGWRFKVWRLVFLDLIYGGWSKLWSLFGSPKLGPVLGPVL